MYHSTAPPPRTPTDDDDAHRRARDNMSGQPPPPPAAQQLPPAYQARSPPTAHYHAAGSSPNAARHHQPPPATYHHGGYSSSRPSSSAAMGGPPSFDQSPRQAHPASPSNGHLPHTRSPYKGPEHKPPTTYYDPTADRRDREPAPPSWGHHSPYSNRLPIDDRDNPYSESKPRDMASLPPHQHQHSSPPSSRYVQLQSPTRQTFHSHPPSHMHEHNPLPQPLAAPSDHSPRLQHGQHSISSLINGSTPAANGHDDRLADHDRRTTPSVDEAKSTRADPMSFSSILSTPTVEKPPPPAAPALSTPAPAPPSAAPISTSSAASVSVSADPSQGTQISAVPVSQGTPKAVNGEAAMPAASVKLEQPVTSSIKKSRRSPAVKDDTPKRDGTPKPRSQKATAQNKKAPALAQAAVEEALREIENMTDAELNLDRYAKSTAHYTSLGQKRSLKVNEMEDISRKKRRTMAASKISQKIDKRVQAQREEFRSLHERDVLSEVHHQEIMDEKERKKDMQRKRRREKTIHQETEKLKLISEKIESTQDPREREKLIKDHHKSQKKVNTTKRILDHGSLPDDLMESLPSVGLLGNLPPLTDTSLEPTKRSRKGAGTRPKKSKEQKQAEKDKAYNAAMESSEPIAIAPKDEKRKDAPAKEDGKSKRRKVDKKEVEEETTPPPATTTYTSKGYLQIYDQIWKDIARKDVPKVYRIKETSLATKQSNLRKTAQLASKEARRWQLKTNKSTKDTQARAKRCMKEMMSFWKRNEREERDLRRVAEKQELDNARKAEAEREANRQKRKLNFLIQQTELYSHFIGKKVKTDEVERSTDRKDIGASQQIIRNGDASAKTIDIANSSAQHANKVTNFEDLDFDAEDETQLEAAAMANAQHAIQEAQDKARAFNAAGDSAMAEMDDGELNFQNPTGLGETEIEQPKMLDCQLKEYQLKGLNWLVNLYEQGINGILADEMGLGKTVQSISVMAYLAETHNIWGPFLVIAPASTLHNWQQEITRFVPSMKVLPYWGNARDRKILRKFWDRRNPTYKKSSPFHCLVTSYQLVVQDAPYFQKMRWQYMILDEAQAIKSSQSSRWKSLLGFHCRNRLLLTGTPIQNNMQELWALLHFIMPSLFDSHDEFSDWFSRDIESHAQSNTKLNEDQLKRLHMILKPFMLRRVKKHVQKELGDKIEEDVYCDLTYRQRSYYTNLRNKISIMDLIEKAASGDDQDTSTLMNLVMQFRKVCNHPDLFERADIVSPFAMAYFAETASFVREGQNVHVGYSTRNMIEYDLPRLICSPEGRIDIAGPGNEKAGFRNRYLNQIFNIWTPDNIRRRSRNQDGFSWLRFVEDSEQDLYQATHSDIFTRAVQAGKTPSKLARLPVIYDDEVDKFEPAHSMLEIVNRNNRKPLAEVTTEGHLQSLMNISQQSYEGTGLRVLEQCSRPAADAPPITVSCSNQATAQETQAVIFNPSMRRALYELSPKDELALLNARVAPANFPASGMLTAPNSSAARYTNIQVPSMRRFVTDSGKLAKLDQLLFKLKEEGHRVLLYFQMTRMIDLMEEYLTYRNYKYLRLDGSTKLEDRRDTVHDFQTRPDIFIFLLSTRAGGLGINLTAADTVIFYDSDWNPTIDSQAMDRAHRLGQTRQVTVYRMITRNTIEERIRKRALQKEEVQRVVISGGSGVDFNTRSKENKTKDIAMWLADDEQAEIIEQKSKEMEERANDPNAKKKNKKVVTGGRKKALTMDEMYHEGEGNFDDNSAKPSADATPMDSDAGAPQKRGPRGGRGLSKKAKTAKQRLAIADGSGDVM